MAYTQEKRIGELKTALGKDKLALTRFTGVEGVSQLFEFRVDATNEEDAPLKFDTAMGKNATVKITTVGEGERYFVGTLTEVQYAGKTNGTGKEAGDQHHYRLMLRPALYMATKSTKSQVFHNKTVTAILTEVLKPYVGAVEDKCSASFTEMEYCVQHGETDFAFACRLMEAHGISYHFAFADDSQKMVISTGATTREDMPGAQGKDRKFIPSLARHDRDAEHISEWQPERRFTTGKAVLNDYNFILPGANLFGEKESDAKYEHGKLEHYEQLYHNHLGKNVSKADGDYFATVRVDMYRAEDNHFIASGDAVCLTPGYIMKLTEHPDDNGEYLVLRCNHSFTVQDYRSTATGTSREGAEETYNGTYVLLPKDQQYAPPMITPKPIIAGVQTAKVVSEQGSDAEIDVDEHGRILVHFHWNRKPETEALGQSMRCRVAQVWAGADWGAQFIPRKGMEVLVQHVDGDPDRPVVIGTVYNGENKPPYPMPGEKNWSGWKSNSTEGGGGYNEYVMKDTKGEELIRQHAQKDYELTTENDETYVIHNNRTTTIDTDETLTITGQRTTDITGNDTLTSKAEITITATSKITLKVGMSKIVMDPGSITISSTSLTTEGTGSAEHKSGGTMTIKGAMVLIN